MQIRQISAVLDTKLRQLEKKLEQLKTSLSQAPEGEQQKIKDDIETLTRMRQKLIKSKEIAWRAHQLQSDSNEQQRARKRLIGLLICLVSGLAGLALLVQALARH